MSVRYNWKKITSKQMLVSVSMNLNWSGQETGLWYNTRRGNSSGGDGV